MSGPTTRSPNLTPRVVAVESNSATGLPSKLSIASNLSDVANTGTSRANLRVPVLLPAACVATANVALTGLQTIDGYTLVDGDQALLSAQTTASQNGPWVAHSGAWTRPSDFPSAGVLKARTITIIGGSGHAKETWLLQTNASVTVDTTAQAWVLAAIGGASGGGATPQFTVGRRIAPGATIRPGIVQGRVPLFTRSGARQTSSNGTDVAEYSVVAKKAIGDGDGVRVLFTNYLGAGFGNTITIKAAVRTADGRVAPLFAGGARAITIDVGCHAVAEGSCQWRSGDIVTLRVFIEPRDASGALIAGGIWPRSFTTAQAAYGETVVSGGLAVDLTLASDASQPAAAVGPAYGPLGIWGARTSPATSAVVLGAHGDSITAGTGDDQTLVNGPGFLARAVAGTIPFLNTAIPGVQIDYATSAPCASMMPLESCSTIYDATGANNLNYSVLTPEDIIDAKLGAWRILSLLGARLRTITLFPRNGIPPAGVTSWAGYNNWVRDGGPIDATTKLRAAIGATGGSVLRFGSTGHYVHGYDEIADLVATDRTACTYKPGMSDDGTHPNSVGAVLASGGVNLGAMV